MTVDEIRELIALASETGIAELEVQRGENRVRIRRAGPGGFSSPQEIVVATQGYTAPPATGASPATTPAAPPAPEPPKPETPAPDPKLYLVKSPIVGTFYESPGPDSAHFVRVGERVQPGKVLCIIESM